MPKKSSLDTFLDNLKCLMDEKHITQKNLEKEIHCAAQTISKWINKRKHPDFEDVDLIAGYFGVSVSALFSEKLSPDELIPIATRSDFMQHLFSLAVSDFIRDVDVQIDAGMSYPEEHDNAVDTRIVLSIRYFNNPNDELPKDCETLSALLKMVSEKRIDERTFRQFASMRIQDMRQRDRFIGSSKTDDDLEDLEV